ncbi:aldolase-type TIM barrel family protein [Artemisia annua]|uniref:indole-3-glycerol-phosphate synthase n=1 Tax=Artemisia annua TaxID=35608 RepID=A0A2U1L8X6_ARTAN|nr:aldolase-type TIM barrel family protein [Artemisia annua]
MMMSSFSLNHTFKLRPSSSTPINYRPSLSCLRLKAQQSGTTDGTTTDVSSSDSKVDVMDFKVRNSQEEISATQGIKIRRRPPTGPPTHYVGPFQFRLQNEGGAACLSVLTDAKYFQGSFENLEAIRKSGVTCPLLCKEFIVDAWQLYYARAKGADAVLLIAAVLQDLDIKYMTKILLENFWGICFCLKVHDENEMDRILAIDGIELIGINNRNLETFEVDISNTKKLLEGERGDKIRQKNIIVVGESGLFTPDDVSYVQEAGVKAILVGESIVKQKDPTKGIAELFGKDISA